MKGHRLAVLCFLGVAACANYGKPFFFLSCGGWTDDGITIG